MSKEIASGNTIQDVSIRKPIWALLVVLLLWSMTPLALVRCNNILPRFALASGAVLVAAAILCIFWGFFKPVVLVQTWKLITLRLAPPQGVSKLRAYARLFGLSAFGFVVYPWLYVQAMNGAGLTAPDSFNSVSDALVVNIINYLWPCFAVIFGWALFRDPLPLKRIGGVSMAFFGALLCVSSITGTRTLVLNWLYACNTGGHVYTYEKTQWFFIFAALGAIAWGIYSALLPHVRLLMPNGTDVLPSSFYLALLLLSSPAHFLYLGISWRTLIAFHYSMSLHGLFYFLIYSAGSLSIAHCLFVYVLRSGRISVASIAASTYFVLTFGTLLLFIFTTSVLSPPVVAGFGLIIAGIFLTRDGHFLSPVPGFIIFFAIAHTLSSYFALDRSSLPAVATEDGSYFAFLGALTGLFAIIAAFTLAKAGTRYVESRRTFRAIVQRFSNLARIICTTSGAKEVLSSLSVALQDAYVSFYVNNYGSLKNKAASTALSNHLNLVGVYVDNEQSTGRLPAEASEFVHELRGSLLEWEATSDHSVTSYEWVVLEPIS